MKTLNEYILIEPIKEEQQLTVRPSGADLKRGKVIEVNDDFVCSGNHYSMTDLGIKVGKTVKYLPDAEEIKDGDNVYIKLSDCVSIE